MSTFGIACFADRTATIEAVKKGQFFTLSVSVIGASETHVQTLTLNAGQWAEAFAKLQAALNQ